jgi:hypothetical protein
MVGNALLTVTSSSGDSYGRGRISTPSITLNTAVFAPMPRASVRTATAANPGERLSCRSP